MPLKLVTIPCLSDNYAFLIHDEGSGETAVIDVPEAAPIRKELDARGWTLSDILLTHHHDDHIQGVAELREATGAKVTGGAADSHRLPPLDRTVTEGDTITVCGEEAHVLDVSGHTVGHIVFHFPASKLVFTADSLMALGCGRLFEGSAPQMWKSLSKIAAMPRDTVICSGHEYTKANADFALTIESGNPALQSRVAAIRAARDKGEPTVPSTLAEELDTNPFLRAGKPEVKEAVGMPDASDAEVFAEIRKRKDNF